MEKDGSKLEDIGDLGKINYNQRKAKNKKKIEEY